MIEGIELFTSSADSRGKRLEQRFLEIQVKFKKVNIFSDVVKAKEMVGSGHFSLPVVKYIDKMGVNFISGDGVMFKGFLDRLDAQLKNLSLGDE